jgi:hypothetical protein
MIGLERGADLPSLIDMDRYLVWDEKRDFVVEFFSQLLYNHIGVEMRLDLSIPVAEKRQWVYDLFTQKQAFVDLVRAAEGNSRDFLCIFGKAYFDEFRQSATSKSISMTNVARAAAAWYDEGKWKNISSEQTPQDTLAHIMNKVLKKYKSRTFLVETSKSEHPRLVRLLNERILHRLNGTYAHPDRPGSRHDLFTVDYGAYVRFRGSVNEVREDVFWDTENKDQLNDNEKELLVPIDNNKSIRRIVFDPDTLAAEGDCGASEKGTLFG